MKTIHVSDKMFEFLINLSNELTSQDHRGTAMPYIFQIQTQELVAAPEGCGTEAWYYDGSKIETEEQITEAIAEYKEISIEDVTNDEHEREQILTKIGYHKINYEMKPEYKNAFLTSKACDEHIKSNKHHYNQPINYLSHSFRNPELETLIEFICSLTGKEIHK